MIKVGDRVRVHSVTKDIWYSADVYRNHHGKTGIVIEIDDDMVQKYLVCFDYDEHDIWCYHVELLYKDYELPMELFKI